MASSEEKDVSGSSSASGSLNMPSVDAPKAETKSQRLKRIPPFLKSIADMDLGAEPQGPAEAIKMLPSTTGDFGQIVADAVETHSSGFSSANPEDVDRYSRYQKRYTDSSVDDRHISMRLQGSHAKPQEDDDENELVSRILKRLNLPVSMRLIDPVTSWVPYIAFAAFASVVVLIWFIVALATSHGSVMANPPVLIAGFVILAVMLVLGVLLGLLMGYLGNKEGDASTVDTMLITLGKAAAAMAVFVAVWSLFMAIAA